MKKYSINWEEDEKHWELNLVAPSPYHHTTNFPQTRQILEEYMPKVLRTECFNDNHLSFTEEVKATETGHLLEHILLEGLCAEKLSSGKTEADFSGRTFWDWKEEGEGRFKIKISKDNSYTSNFQNVLEKSLNVLDLIFSSTASVLPNLASLKN